MPVGLGDRGRGPLLHVDFWDRGIRGCKPLLLVNCCPDYRGGPVGPGDRMLFLM